MADTSAQADIRGLDINKLARGFADEALVLKNLVNNSKTTNREIRWYKKTAGFLDSADTSAITDSQIANTSAKSLPVVIEASWTRQTSYVRKYFVESPWLSIEDIKDTDVDILATNVRDIARAVARQIDIRILAVLGDTLGTGGNVNTAAATADGWNDTATGDPVEDILEGLEQIKTYNYDIDNISIYMNQKDYHHLLHHLIYVKGSSIPNFASDKVKSGKVMELLGCSIIVSDNMSNDTVVMGDFKKACTWKDFLPLQTVVINDPGMGKKIRCWAEGEAILTDPRAVHVITDTVV